MISYKNLDKYICDRVYRVETKDHGVFKGLLINYYWGNLVLLTVKGVVHLEYKDIAFMAPVKPNDELQKMIDEVLGENNENN